MTLIEHGETIAPLSLDVVRARIFYLACDVEPVSPPAAMLLRAVADAIEDNGAVEQSAAIANSNGALAAVLSQASSIGSLGAHRVGGAAPERRLGVVSSQSGFKR